MKISWCSFCFNTVGFSSYGKPAEDEDSKSGVSLLSYEKTTESLVEWSGIMALTFSYLVSWASCML